MKFKYTSSISKNLFIIILLLFGAILSIVSCELPNEPKIDPGPVETQITMTIAAPQGGEVLKSGDTFKIQWQSNTSTNVLLEYTTGGTRWDTITSSYPNSGSFYWSTIPSITSNNCKIKITTKDSQPVSKESNIFSIEKDTSIKKVTLVSPGNGEILFVDSSYTINWISTGIQALKIELSTDNGLNWNTVSATTPADTGQFKWANIPNFVSNTCKLKLTDVSTDSIFAITSGNFSIKIPTYITIKSPNGGENLLGGGVSGINWISSSVEHVKIEYTTDNGINWNTIINTTPSDGYYEWSPVPNVSSNNCNIRISDVANNLAYDVSDNLFSIFPEQTLKLTSPNGSEKFFSGSGTTITWITNSIMVSSTEAKTSETQITGKANKKLSSNISVAKKGKSVLTYGTKSLSSIANVKLEYSSDGGSTWSSIIASTANNGSYYWQSIPNINSSLCLVKVSDAEDGSPFDVSDNPFTIFNKVEKTIRVTVPNGGDIWNAGTAQNITWNSTGVSSVKIEYTTNNGVNWTTLDTNTPSDGFYVWNSIPTLASTNCKIRITDAVDTTAFDLSDEVFTISPEPYVNVLTPNGGEALTFGTSQKITWTSANIRKVKIDYTINNGADWVVITDSIESTGSYDWTVPNANSNLSRIKISDAADGVPFDLSDADFTISNQIKKEIRVSSPNGGEILSAGTSQNITWLSSGISKVKIEYTSDNGIKWSVIVDSTEADGSYQWAPVPNVSSSQCKIKITDKDGTTSDISDTAFSIKPVQSVKVIYPNNGEVFTAGDPVVITWESIGIENVGIDYTITNGLKEEDWFELVSSTPSDGEYQTGFSISSNQYRIRIKDVPDGTPMDACDGTFTVLPQPTITVTAPNGGENLVSGNKTNITWVSTYLDSVKLEYTTNNGASWVEIAATTSSDGMYGWTVPGVSSALCKIRVSDAKDNAPSDLSDNNFTISQSQLKKVTITSPNGGEKWEAGSSQNITWTSDAVDSVQIEYTIDNGVNWATLIASTPSTGFYNWNPIPKTPSTNCKIRITDVGNLYSDMSDVVFSILPETNINVLSPNGGESLTLEASQKITWTSANIRKVKIDYSINNGADWVVITDSIESTGSYDWTVPNVNTSLGRIRISDAADGIPFDISDADFTISNQVKKEISVNSPNGGDILSAGTSQDITWTSRGISKVKIEYTTDNGIKWSVIVDSTEADGSYQWAPVPNISSSQCKIKITDKDGATSDESDAVFSIKPIQSVKVNYPNNGEVFTAGDPVIITWESVGIENVGIDYTVTNGLKEEDWFELVSSTPSDGEYQTGFSISSNQYRIRIKDVSDGTPMDASDGTFTVLPQSSVVVTAPNGGENLVSGNKTNITWVSTYLDSVKLEYTTNNGASWVEIAATTPSDGLYEWSVPAVSSSLCKIRVSAAKDKTPSDLSDNNFMISQSQLKRVTITSPNGGEKWEAGSSQNITWTSDAVQTVKIEYTIDNGVNWTTLIASTPSTGFYNWNPIPKTPSTNCKIRITNVGDLYSDMSDEVFSVTPETNIKVLSPNGGEALTFGTSQKITWTSANIRKVKLDYSINSGADWVVITDSIESTGTYDWTVPNVNSNLCVIRISDALDGVPFDISDADFMISNQIKKEVTVSSPNGGEILSAGTSQNITWTSNGISKVKIEYTSDNGINWSVIVDSTDTDGSYQWAPVPDISSSQCKIKITDKDGTINDVSDAVFSIQPIQSIKVIFPNNGEVFTAGEQVVIKWESTGIENVRIDYTVNNGLLEEDWFELVSSTPSDGEYETGFSVPSNLYRIRIKDVLDGTPMDACDGIFKVLQQPTIIVTAPNGGENLVSGNKTNVTWVSTYIDSVKLEYTTNNGASWVEIAVSTPSDGLYEWSVPAVSSSLCKLKISDTKDNTPSDLSDDNFKISQNQPRVAVTSPNGGEKWEAGSSQNITWTSDAVQAVKIEYSVDNGVNWTTLITSTPSTGFYNWNPISKISSTNCKIRITDVANLYSDLSDGVFSITPEAYVKILSPNGAENWLSGNLNEIRWSSVGVADVNIDYSINNGASWTTIASSTPSDGSYSWTVADENTEQARIKISDASDGVPSDTSDANFSIYKDKILRLVFPNGGEKIYLDTNIVWTSVNIAKVGLKYSLDNGYSWKQLVDSMSSTGSLRWKIPTTDTSSLVRILVYDISDLAINDMNDSYFFLNTDIPVFNVRIDNPKVSESSPERIISWESSPQIKLVKLEYSMNNGKNWVLIEDNYLSAKGSNKFIWKYPSNIDVNKIIVKVSDKGSNFYKTATPKQ